MLVFSETSTVIYIFLFHNVNKNIILNNREKHRHTRRARVIVFVDLKPMEIVILIHVYWSQILSVFV